MGALKTHSSRLAHWTGLLVAVTLFLAAGTASAGAPTDFIKKHTDDVTRLLGQEESEERARKFSAKAETIIDFRELASRALEGHWKQRSAEDQDQFLALLQQLLEANYKKKLQGNQVGEDYQIEYLEEKQRDERALVRTKVKWGDTEKKQKPVEYRMMKTESGWVVYDLVIDDISLEETYRESYTKIIEEDGWDELISKMKEKIEELKSADDEKEGEGDEE
jgi:phospholipid transport system substrate-binding protein